jgi:hypothetical protein
MRIWGETPQVEVVEGIPICTRQQSPACTPPFVRPDSKREASDYPALAAFDTKADRIRNSGCCYWL